MMKVSGSNISLFVLLFLLDCSIYFDLAAQGNSFGEKDENEQVEYMNGFRHRNTGTFYSGPFFSTFENGSKKAEGIVLEGKYFGPWRWYYETGSIKEEKTFLDGSTLLTGVWRIWYPDGKPKCVAYHNKKGERTGTWWCKYENGKPLSLKVYAGCTEILESLIPISGGHPDPLGYQKMVKKTVRACTDKSWDEHGILTRETYHDKKGKKHGKWVYRDEGGKIISEELWNHGKKLNP